MNSARLVAQVRAVGTSGPSDAADKIVELIEAHDDILERTCRPGHLTGSGLVMERHGGRLLVLFHTKLRMWLQPGGHADGDPDLGRVALREAVEETGIEALEVLTPAIDLDIHTVHPPSEDAHLHLDVRYLVLAQRGSVPQGNHESEAIRWVDAVELAALGCDDGLIRLARRGLDLASQLGVVR